MKFKPRHVFHLAGMACFALLAGSVHAVTVSSGDLILGFRASGGQGAGVNLEVNIGPASNYYAPASSSFIVSGLSPLDLVSTYGSDWASRSDLAWGIVGTTGISAVGIAPARTIWASNAEPSPGILSQPWPRSSASGLQNSSNAIATMYSGAAGSLINGSATPNSAMASMIDNTLGGSWTVQDDGVVGVSFRRFNPTVTGVVSNMSSTPSIYDGTGYGVLDLWEVQPGTAGDPGTLVGGFGLNSLGNLVFSTDPGVFIPEPSVTAFTLLAALAGIARRRRTATV
jgi:hypothetical protein